MPETPPGQAGHGPPGPGDPPAPGSVTHQYDLRERAAFIRAETVRLIDIAKTGHYTSVFSAAEILAVLAYGVTVAPALEAARAAAADGVTVAVADVHTLKPLDSGAVERAARAAHGILVAEEHNTTGGLATAVAGVLADLGLRASLHRIGIPDEYAPVGPPTHL